MIVISIDGYKCHVRGALDHSVEDQIRNVCSYEPDGAKWSLAYQTGEWDGQINIYRFRWFPIGLLSRVVFILILNEVEYRIDDRRREPTKIQMEFGGELREYQQEIVEKAVENEVGVIQSPTGAGKTVCQLAVAAKLGVRTLIIEPTIDLVDQVAAACEKFLGFNPGIYQADREPGNENLVVATWETIYSRLLNEPKRPRKGKVETTDEYLVRLREFEVRLNEWREGARKVNKFLTTFDLVHFDECHVVGSKSVSLVASRCPAKYRYGWSATAFRNDGRDLEITAGIGTISQGATASQLIELGYLVPPKIHFHSMPYIDIPGRKPKWPEVYKRCVTDNRDRNQKLAQLTRELVKEDRVTLMMVSQIKHGKNMEEILRDIGAKFVSGRSTKNERKDITEKLRAGELSCVISSSIWNQGVDFPVVSGMVLAGPYKSPIVNIQRVGRGLRLYGGKEDVKVVETIDPYPYLHDHTYARLQLYSEEPGFQVTGDFPRGVI